MYRRHRRRAAWLLQRAFPKAFLLAGDSCQLWDVQAPRAAAAFPPAAVSDRRLSLWQRGGRPFLLVRAAIGLSGRRGNEACQVLLAVLPLAYLAVTSGARCGSDPCGTAVVGALLQHSGHWPLSLLCPPLPLCDWPSRSRSCGSPLSRRTPMRRIPAHLRLRLAAPGDGCLLSAVRAVSSGREREAGRGTLAEASPLRPPGPRAPP